MGSETETSLPLRLAVDATIEHQGAILLVEYEDERLGRHFGLPGGGGPDGFELEVGNHQLIELFEIHPFAGLQLKAEADKLAQLLDEFT